MMIRTLEVKEVVGESLVGSARVGARHPPVEIGKMAPMFRKSEEPDGLVRASFLDPTVPIEINLLHWPLIRRALQRLAVQAPTHADWLNPSDLIRGRPAIGYVPPDALTEVYPAGIKALTTSGPVGRQISALRAGHPDANFWAAVADTGLYVPWLQELRAFVDAMGASLLAPPVPVVQGDLATSPDGQYAVNLAAANYWREMVTQDAGGAPTLIEAYLRQRQIGLLYALPVHPTAFRNKVLLEKTLRYLDMALASGDNPYWGVHLHLFDMGLASRQGRPAAVKEFVREVARIATNANVLTWVSDAGAVGPALLDLGVSFTSYHSGMTPGRVYGDGGGPGEKELQYGKIIELWKYNLCDRAYVESRNWTLEDTGLFNSVVPMSLRNTTPPKWRIGFSRPHNTAVAEKINQLREQELRKGNVAPGRSHIGKSNDDRIAPWAA
ncbi:MAG: hypothetical protein HY556_09565 [Euryarchaeota archaeon]|nr:hypothetical protein [Euryarchaeota archaeon]